MWVYRQDGGNWAVGYYGPDKGWNQESSFVDKEEAAARVHYLNGGGRSQATEVAKAARRGYMGT